MNKEVVINEKQFSDWFIKNYKNFGFEKILKKNVSTSPDFILLKDNKKLGIELETLASNFIQHKHDLKKVDAVFCLVKDIDLTIPIKVVNELSFEPAQKRVTLSLDSDVYEEFQNFCEENDIIISKRVERLMKEEIENKKGEKRK